MEFIQLDNNTALITTDNVDDVLKFADVISEEIDDDGLTIDLEEDLFILSYIKDNIPTKVAVIDEELYKELGVEFSPEELERLKKIKEKKELEAGITPTEEATTSTETIDVPVEVEEEEENEEEGLISEEELEAIEQELEEEAVEEEAASLSNTIKEMFSRGESVNLSYQDKPYRVLEVEEDNIIIRDPETGKRYRLQNEKLNDESNNFNIET